MTAARCGPSGSPGSCTQGSPYNSKHRITSSPHDLLTPPGELSVVKCEGDEANITCGENDSIGRPTSLQPSFTSDQGANQRPDFRRLSLSTFSCLEFSPPLDALRCSSRQRNDQHQTGHLRPSGSEPLHQQPLHHDLLPQQVLRHGHQENVSGTQTGRAEAGQGGSHQPCSQSSSRSW